MPGRPRRAASKLRVAHFAAAGLRSYGFSPLRLPVGFRFGAMFHGPDEKVPVDGLEFGVAVR